MKISIKISKTNGSLEMLRFRVRDGRSTELSYSTKERINVNELCRCYVCNNSEKFITSNLVPVKGVRRINAELKETIEKYASALTKVCDEIRHNPSLCNAKALYERMDRELNGDKEIDTSELLEARYEAYINNQFENSLLSHGRYAHYMVSLRELRRFLIIKKIQTITVKEFDGERLLELRTFLENEYKYVTKYKSLYVGMDDRQIPRAPRSQNTITSKLKFYRTFFNYLHESGEIERSPFAAIGVNNRKVIMKERYDEPVYLTVEEMAKIRGAEIPEEMNVVRDVFLLHCQLGARIEDFKALSLSNVYVNEKGFAYVRYQPSKTKQENGMVVETPLMLSGLQTIRKYGFRFPILNNLWGQNGYNHKIKELARLAKLDREITTTVGGLQTRKLHELVSTKICRKSFVTAMQQAQIDDFAAGLHSEKSDSVHRYGNASSILENRFVLMCAAFGEKPYKTDSHLSV